MDPRPYFRLPYGAVNAATISPANAECYLPSRWTVDTLGWEGTAGGMSADGVLQRVIDAVRAQGYTLVTLESVLPATP